MNRIEQEDGSFSFQVPAIAGDYEIAYFHQPGNRIIERVPLSISQATATVDLPDTVKAGDAISISYSGDGFKGDRIVICPADTPDNKMWQWGVNYGVVARAGETTGVFSEAKSARTLSGKPGAYEARYVTGLQHVVIARDRFVVVE